ncbi:carboxymuconolactone decarboxylase family protein [Pseudonocardia xishanensis]|uniref:Carboxymuconolactone decarboxylase-like domain-containing protein n=1 Tax=Pseudonocardia xishanensis TaxID=630995 RepID=A0ABP8RPM3_9PSEU
MPLPHSSDPRVAPVEDPEPEVADLLAKTMSDDDGVPLSIFRTMARHPRMMKRFNVLGGFFLTRGDLPARERELCILRTAYRSGSEYEWAQHVLIGRDAGLTDDEIERVALGGDWPEADAALLRLTDEVLDHTDVSDTTWWELAEHYTDAQLCELVLLVGFYRMTAGFLNAAGVVKEDSLPSWPATGG